MDAGKRIHQISQESGLNTCTATEYIEKFCKAVLWSEAHLPRVCVV